MPFRQGGRLGSVPKNGMRDRSDAIFVFFDEAKEQGLQWEDPDG